MTGTTAGERVLVIKLGALGDFLMALGPMQAIRRHHPGAEITLLTRPAYRDLGSASGLFDAVWDDPAPGWNPFAWLAWRSRLRGAGFSRVYDLQTSDRSAGYFRLFRPGPVPEWSGKVAGCSHRHVYPEPNTQHTIDRQRAQLAVAGIEDVPLADLGFLNADVSDLIAPGPYAVLIPGASANRPEKRWPAERYRELAQRLAERGITVLVAGTAGERDLAAAIGAGLPLVRPIAGRTDLAQLATVARGAAAVIGNDTGPTHLAALAGAPTLALFAGASDPGRVGPRGPRARILQRADFRDLTVDSVMGEIVDWLPDRA
jgi:ADP-heptose:LPS heptosyltransferase